MASVFLSYAREDAAKAKSLAGLLERAGHNVWWDRHIRSGSEFAGAIEEALKRADAVLVLWSEGSVRSSWVRDEAAEGRDSGRLVAAVLDGSRPPIGFRQFQSTDLSGWSGKGRPKAFADLLNAIGDKAPAPAEPQEVGESPRAATPQRSSAKRRVRAGVLAFAAIAALLFGTWLYLDRGSASAETPTIAVLPFADLSPEGDKAYFADGVAEAILTMLAREPGLNVIGRTSSWQFKDRSADLAAIRKALGVTHVLEGSARTSGDQLRMSVRLVDASDGRQLWAEDYQRRMSNIFAVQDEIGRAVAQRLKGSLAAPLAQAQRQVTEVDTYTLYLAARAKMRERKQRSLEEALGLSKRVIAADPQYAPAYALYAETLWLLSDNIYGNIPRGQMQKLARPYAVRAIQLAPHSAEGYAALGAIQVWEKPEAAVEPLRRAISLDPARGELRLWLALAYGELGRNAEALEQYQAAVEMEPLWATPLLSYAPALAGGGRFDEALALLDRFERRGGSPSFATRIRADLYEMRGDYSEAVRLWRLAMKMDPETPQADRALAESYLVLGLHQQAEQITRNMHPYERLSASGDQESLLSEVRKAGSAIWTHPHPDIAIHALANRRDWRAIERLYDTRPVGGQVVCGSPEFDVAFTLAMGLHRRGRSDEASTLIRCLRERLAKATRGPIRHLPDSDIAAFNSQILALEGNAQGAFRTLDRAIDRGFRTPHAAGLSSLPAFDTLRTEQEYRRLDVRLKQLIARERREVLQQQVSRD